MSEHRAASPAELVDDSGILPGRIRPEDWTTGQADPAVPGSVLVAEAERSVEGYSPAG